MKSAADWGTNYQKGMASASTAYSAGIDGVTESPMAKAADNIDRMRAGLIQALDSGYTERQLRNASLTDWKAKAKTKGASALAAAGKLAAPKMARWAAIAQPLYAQAKSQIAAMPKGGRANAIARINAQLDAVEQAKAAYRAQK